MPDKEKARLAAEVAECRRLSRAASDALDNPRQSMILGGEVYQHLLRVDADARANLNTAVLALRAYRAYPAPGLNTSSPSLKTEPVKLASILIVEDEALIAEHLSSTLSRLGYEIAGIAESSEEALAAISEAAPQMIIMDIRIRGALDGIATAAVIRERFDIPLIYLTAHTDQETIDRAKLTGALGFLS
jgi:CheY-like chemotaxis protein